MTRRWRQLGLLLRVLCFVALLLPVPASAELVRPQREVAELLRTRSPADQASTARPVSTGREGRHVTQSMCARSRAHLATNPLHRSLARAHACVGLGGVAALSGTPHYLAYCSLLR
jgi:hypothetical protein